MSGVFGIVLNTNCWEELTRGAPLLQQRGDDWGGFSILDKDKKIHATPPEKGKITPLLTREGPKIRETIPGEIQVAIVHMSQKDPQPVTIEETRMGPISLAFDGKITNREELQKRSPYLVGTDPEILARLVAAGKDPVDGLKRVYQSVKGPFSLVLLTPEGLFAARDILGIRPLTVGRFFGDKKIGCIVASESIAFEQIGMERIRDVKPGEMIEIESTGFRIIEQIPSPGLIICGFEHGFWARSSSTIEDIPVGLARHNAGMQLAPKCPKVDIITSFPISGNTAAEGLAEATGIPYRSVFDYNTEAGGRSFIPLSTSERDRRARDKLLIMPWAVIDKRVVGVDDSLVEGRQTLARIYLIKRAGAKEGGVFLMIETPMMQYPCGFDVTPRGELMAATHNRAEMAKELGVESIEFNEPDAFAQALISAQFEERIKKNPIKEENICLGCFTGEHPKYK